MSHSLTIIICHTLNILIGILSIAILALVAHSVAITDSLQYVYPSDTKGLGRSLLFWPGVGGIVDMLLFLFLWKMMTSTDAQTKKRIAYWNGLVFVACFIFGRPLIVLIYTFVEWSEAIKGQLNVSGGYLTTETWACAAAKEGSLQKAESLCRELQAARYLLIPEVVCGTLMLGLVLWMRVNLAKEGTLWKSGKAKEEDSNGL